MGLEPTTSTSIVARLTVEAPGTPARLKLIDTSFANMYMTIRLLYRCHCCCCCFSLRPQGLLHPCKTHHGCGRNTTPTLFTNTMSISRKLLNAQPSEHTMHRTQKHIWLYSPHPFLPPLPPREMTFGSRHRRKRSLRNCSPGVSSVESLCRATRRQDKAYYVGRGQIRND